MKALQIVFTLVVSTAFGLPAYAQKNCRKGIPCGNSCISAKKTCRIGSGTARTSPPRRTAPRTAVPPPIVTPPPQVAPAKPKVSQFADQTPLRSAPSHHASINGHLPHGAKYTTYGTADGGWVLISDPNLTPHHWLNAAELKK